MSEEQSGEQYDYDADLSIDESALDIEWLNQARTFMKYARLYANARRDYDYAKDRLEVLKAQLDRKIRADPEVYGINKVTENTIMTTILVQDEYKEKNVEAQKCRYESEILAKAVQAFDQRKTALENLVKLHGQSYFAGPKVPRDIVSERKQEVAIKPVRRREKR